MLTKQISLEKTADELISGIGNRARGLFLTRQLMCSEAVLVVINQSLGGRIPPELCMRLASGFPEGMGGSGCTCGALSGAIMSLGVFLGRSGPGFGNGKRVAIASRWIHDQFKKRYGATCCRVLIKKLKRGSDALYTQCAERTGWTAEMTGTVILEQKPELLHQADWDYLNESDSRIRAGFRKLLHTVCDTKK